MKRECFIGIDVSKAYLDMAVLPTGERWRSPNDEPGIASLVNRLLGLQPALVVLEATGGGSKHRLPAQWQLLACLWQLSISPGQGLRQSHREACKNGRPGCRHPRKIRISLRPDVRPLPDADASELAALLQRRRQIIEMLVAEKNRLCSSHSSISKSIKRNIDWLENNWPRSMETSPILSVKAPLARKGQPS